jgi:class 3 adenylate cyclase
MTDATPDEHATTDRPRERTLRFQLTAVFILAVLLAVLIVGLLNILLARQLLGDGVQEQLSTIGRSRALSIEQGTTQLRAETQAIAADGGIALALDELAAAYDETQTETLTADERAALDSFYEERVVDPLTEIGIEEFGVDDLVPTSPAGQYLQYHYLVEREAEGIDAADLDDAGDGSAYSEAHARHHPFLADLTESLSGGDVLLIDPSGTVVYTSDKRLDLGTNLVVGPYQDTELADAVLNDLPGSGSRETVLADWEIYLPASGQPTLFLVSAVRRDGTALGAVAIEIPSSALSAVTTARGRWDEVGLPSGESYVVGPDLRLRSESRLWIEDPEEYLELVDDPELETLIEAFGSPVGLQLVNTEPARAALDGETFDGNATNYLGQPTFTSAVPLDVEGVNWVVVVDTPLADTRQALATYIRRMGLLLLVLVSLAGLIGFVSANTFARRIPPLVDAAHGVAEGDRHPDVNVRGGGEFADLGRRLEHLARELAQQEEDLETEYERRRSLLLSVLPPRLVNHEGEVGTDVDQVRPSTVIAIGLDFAEGSNKDEQLLVNIVARLRDRLIAVGADLGIEPVRLAADRSLFITGAGSKSVGADAALRFAREAALMAEALDEGDDLTVAVRVGVASGTVASGVLSTGSLTFAAWGEPVRRALAIVALARADEILVDETTISEVRPDEFEFEPARNVISLGGEPLGVKRYVPAPRAVTTEQLPSATADT